jgi:23S rRNA (cytosine1962-C5)-methyltransferase
MGGQIWLKKGRDRPVLRRHPWIFSGGVARVEGEPVDGDVVDVRDAGGNWLARGTWNSRSQINVRILTWDPDQRIDGPFWERRLERAVAGRAALANDPRTTAYRLVHAESDALPGLIVDRYGSFLVVQFLTLGMVQHRDQILSILGDQLVPSGIYERSDVDVREKEGLDPWAGPAWGDEPPPRFEVLENGHRFWVDVREGQKTGLYLDQRENRARLSLSCAGARVLDAFSYAGAFGVYAAAGGAAHITFVDTSAGALEMARQNMALNGYDPAHHAFVEGNVFGVLRGYRAQERDFDVVVLDPPKFAATGREVERAARAYKDINLLAFQLLRPGGLLFSTSCSGAVSADLFQKIVFGAALDAGRDAQIVGTLFQAADHPVALTFPEGAYLKGLICRVW